MGCRTVVARPESGSPPSAADYTLYHRDADFRMPELVQASLDAVATLAEPHRRLGSWLDLGFGEGALLRTAERHGWRCYGIEVSPQAISFGRAQGWSVAEPPAAAESFPEKGFDVVTLIEVIEHLVDPNRVLAQALAWLRPGGLLYVTTPNADSLNRRLLGPHWSIFCPPQHLTIWSPRGLRAALSRAGLTRVRLWTHGLNPVEVLARVRGLGPDTPVHRQHAADSLNRALTRSAGRRLVKRTANGLLSLVGAGDTLKACGERPDPGSG